MSPLLYWQSVHTVWGPRWETDTHTHKKKHIQRPSLGAVDVQSNHNRLVYTLCCVNRKLKAGILSLIEINSFLYTFHMKIWKLWDNTWVFAMIIEIIELIMIIDAMQVQLTLKKTFNYIKFILPQHITCYLN